MTDGVIVAAYCHRGRGGEKKQIFISEDGNIFDCSSLSADWTRRDHMYGIVSINSRKGEG
jgi:hypothetical protein